MVEKAEIGIIGLGVMGHSLALNMERNGYAVAGLDLDAVKMQNFVNSRDEGRQLIPSSTSAELMAVLERPRRILMMVPAGRAVDSVIAQLKPLMEPGDIVIDGGNSFFEDTERRCQTLESAGLKFVGMGVSGGEEGALWGPSLMPGGPREAWEALSPILTAIAARADDGEPCVAYIGPRGSGHYVKMVHNGIEYGDMQLIAEAYDMLRRGLGLPAQEIGEIFARWNEGVLQSYLMEITADILSKQDADTGKPLVDLIVDEAKQKGTGGWAAQDALDIGAATPTISVAVESRIISSFKEQRVQASALLRGPAPRFTGDPQPVIDAVHDALYASRMVAYAQGMSMLRVASDEYGYGLNLAEIARIWRAGCIIRARMLNDIMDAYRREPDLFNLMIDEDFRRALANCQDGWRMVVQQAVGMGIPLMAMAASLSYYDAFRSSVLPANLIQAQRDYFGAHTYRRVDKPGVFHTVWVEGSK